MASRANMTQLLLSAGKLYREMEKYCCIKPRNILFQQASGNCVVWNCKPC